MNKNSFLFAVKIWVTSLFLFVCSQLIIQGAGQPFSVLTFCISYGALFVVMGMFQLPILLCYILSFHQIGKLEKTITEKKYLMSLLASGLIFINFALFNISVNEPFILLSKLLGGIILFILTFLIYKSKIKLIKKDNAYLTLLLLALLYFFVLDYISFTIEFRNQITLLAFITTLSIWFYNFIPVNSKPID